MLNEQRLTDILPKPLRQFTCGWRIHRIELLGATDVAAPACLQALESATEILFQAYDRNNLEMELAHHYPASRTLARRFKLTPCSAASMAKLRCSSGGILTLNCPL